MLSVEIGLLVAAVASAAFAFITHRTAKKAREHQIVYDLMFEYRTAHMLAGIRSLHEFYREWTKKGKNLKAIYDKIKKEDEEEYDRRSASEKTQFLENTLHNQRRLVSQFFAIIKATLDLNLVKEKYIFRYWHSGTLKIIPDVIDPIGQDPDKYLMQLYNKAVEYEKKHKKKEVPIGS